MTRYVASNSICRCRDEIYIISSLTVGKTYRFVKQKYLEKIKRFKGVISPDFSIYRNMPLAMQIWNNYKGRTLSEVEKDYLDAIKTIEDKAEKNK